MLQTPPIDYIVKTIVERMNPRRVVLFGSYANGTARADSDVDLMIEMETTACPPERAMAIDALFGLRGWAMDVFVYTPAEVRQLHRNVGTLVYEAEHTGRVLYQAA